MNRAAGTRNADVSNGAELLAERDRLIAERDEAIKHLRHARIQVVPWEPCPDCAAADVFLRRMEEGAA